MAESPPCRTVVMTARILGVDLDIVNINLQEQEQKSDKYSAVSEDFSNFSLILS